MQRTGYRSQGLAVAAIRLLALTGCRRSEVLNLRWGDIRKNAIVLPDSKTGPRSLPRPRRNEEFLCPKNAGRHSPYNIVACWRTVRADANLGRFWLHNLRHTGASHADMSGEHLPLVGKLLGHKRHETTAGYSHLADVHLVEAAEKVGARVARAMKL